MATIEKGEDLVLPLAMPGEPVDILSFVVTNAGWEELKKRIGISSSNPNPIRLLTRLIYQSVIDPIKQAGGDWHWLPKNHAKVILYGWQKKAVLGSFNLTGPSLGDNLECLSQVDHDYQRLAAVFQKYWETTEKDDNAIVPPGTLLQALAATIDPTEEDMPGLAAADRQAELTDGCRNPWPYQEKIIEQVMAWLANGRDAELGRIVKLPTGAGKTLVAAEVIRRLLDKKPHARILWVCHRVELLLQSWERTRDQINGAISENSWFIPQHVKNETCPRDPKEFCRSRDCQIVFCTQGMLPHLLRYNSQKHFDLTVADECHRFHPHSTTYQLLYKYCNRKRIPRLGLTATPLDPDRRGFGKYWNTELMYGQDLTLKTLVQDGFLSRIHEDLTVHWETGFRFQLKQQPAGSEGYESEILTHIRDFDHPEINRAVVKAWTEYCNKRKRVLCFAVTIDHVKTLKTHYFAGNDCVKVLHSKLTRQENRKTLEWFAESTTESRMLLSVLMLAEGIDLPQTDCLFMVRPTFSQELHQQMIGRGLRGPKAGGTEDCAVVDFTYQFVDRKGQLVPQVTTGNGHISGADQDGTAQEEDDSPDDLDASGRIWTVKDLRQAVDDLQEKGRTIHEACEELAQELDYAESTLVNYYHTKPDNYSLGWEDQETDPAEQSDDGPTQAVLGTPMNGLPDDANDTPAGRTTEPEGNITMSKLLDLRCLDPQSFEEIASLTKVAPNTLRSYCSDQKNFRRWKANNKDTMGHVRVILTESLARNSDAA